MRAVYTVQCQRYSGVSKIDTEGIAKDFNIVMHVKFASFLIVRVIMDPDIQLTLFGWHQGQLQRSLYDREFAQFNSGASTPI